MHLRLGSRGSLGTGMLTRCESMYQTVQSERHKARLRIKAAPVRLSRRRVGKRRAHLWTFQRIAHMYSTHLVTVCEILQVLSQRCWLRPGRARREHG